MSSDLLLGKDIEGIDAGILDVVLFLNKHGVETYESCQGGEGHAFFEPTVRFHGERTEGYRVAALLLQHGYQPAEIRRAWGIQQGELSGPYWEVTLSC